MRQSAFSKLFLILLLIPLIEIAILFQLAHWIGFWETILIQVGTAFLGASLAKYEGLRVWINIQTELNQGLMPAEKMIDGLMIFAGGIVLLTPGLLTDILGFLLLIPFTRKFFKKWLHKKFERMRSTGETGFTTIMIE